MAAAAKEAPTTSPTTPAAPSVPPMTRREFLYYIWAASMALFLAEAGGAIVWFAIPRFKAGEFGGVFTLDIADVPPVDTGPVAFDAGRFWLVNNGDKELAHLYAGREPVTPQGRGLRPFLQRFNLPRSAFEDLIDGVAMDLEERRYETFEALRQYCLRVASAVGLICVEIFGYRDFYGLRLKLSPENSKIPCSISS